MSNYYDAKNLHSFAYAYTWIIIKSYERKIRSKDSINIIKINNSDKDTPKQLKKFLMIMNSKKKKNWLNLCIICG